MANEKLFPKPLYVFDLPEDLLKTLYLKTEVSQDAQTESKQTIAAAPERETAPQAHHDEKSSNATSCALCGLTFATLQEQRSHVRSDLHKYNLKQKIKGQEAVSETQFEQLIGELDESISGSESDDSSDEDGENPEDKPDILAALLKRQAKVAAPSDGDDVPARTKRKRGAGKPPVLWFGSEKVPSNTSLGLYRAIFTDEEQSREQEIVQSLSAKQLGRSAAPKKAATKADEDDEDGGVPLPGVVASKDIKAAGPHYFLCMIGGGHFAAMLVSLTPKLTKKGLVDDRSASIIAHKTFHRYTTRRKQGGSQSANDNSKGNAHSAGSSLRRYNEAALESDVRSLLADWRPWIDTSDLLFVRATGTTNRRTLFGPYEGHVLDQRDARLRSFPFNTRRATQSELMRAFVELTRVKVSTIDEAALARQAAGEAAQKKKQQAQQAQSRASTPSKPTKLSKEEEAAMLHTTQIQALIRRSKAPALVSYFTSNNLPPDFRLVPAERNHHAPTALHLAASSNATACVTALLTKVGADPNVRNDDGKTAYELAGDRATRDAFSLARGQLGEERWRWNDAKVPAAITQAEVDERVAKEKEEKLAEEKAEKERRQIETQKLRQEDAAKQNTSRDKKYGIGKTLSSMPMTAEQRRMEDAKGMTDEMRLKIERERRARAAEERMRRLQGQ